MALDRWVALVLLGICLTYGYTAWFMMDSTLPPIMKRLAVWPSSFPKVLSIAGIILSLIVVLGLEKGLLVFFVLLFVAVVAPSVIGLMPTPSCAPQAPRSTQKILRRLIGLSCG
jgi:hypothetical protein